MLYWPPGMGLPFRVLFTCNGIGATTLAVTVDVYAPAGARIITGAVADEHGAGVYGYELDAAAATERGPYVAYFRTTAGYVHQRLLADRIVVGPPEWAAPPGVDAGLTQQELYRLLLAALAGPGSGGGSTLLRFFDPGRARQRVRVELDSRRNRASVLLDAGEVLVAVGSVPWDRLAATDPLYAALDGSVTAGDGDGVVYWPGQAGNAAALQPAEGARPVLDAGPPRAVRMTGGSWLAMDQAAGLATGDTEWGVAMRVELPAVGAAAGAQMLLSLGTTADAGLYTELSVPAVDNPRWNILRSGAGGSVSINGQYAAAGEHTYAAIVQGGAVDLGIDGAWNGPRSLGAAVDVPATRMTIAARRRNGGASLPLPAGAKLRDIWLWQGAVTAKEVTDELALAGVRPLVREQRVVGSTGVHNAFPALYRHEDRWLLCYRESPSVVHTDPGAVLRIYASDDYETWELVATLTPPDLERQSLQEGRFCQGPGGTVLLYTVIRYPTPSTPQVESVVYVSSDGENWSPAAHDMPAGFWFWRPALMPDGTYLCAAYNLAAGTPRQRLYAGSDGLEWTVRVPVLTDRAGATEAALAWSEHHERCYYMSRIDGAQTHLRGWSEPPYTTWQIEEAPLRMQSPVLVSRGPVLIAGARAVANRTVFDWWDPATGVQDRIVNLPSGASAAPESGYPDAVVDGESLRIAWYGNHLGYHAVETATLLPGEPPGGG